MKVMTLGWLSVFFAILLMNVYIWHCYWKIPFRTSRLLKALSYATVHVALTAVSVYYFVLYFSGKTDSIKAKILSYVAGFYITFLHYSVLLFLSYDLVSLTGKFINYPDNLRIITKKIFYGGFLIFGISALIAILSIFNAQKVITKEYNVNIEKRDSSLDSLVVAYLADGHFTSTDDIDKIVKQVNDQHPDIIVLGGDFFDEGTAESIKDSATEKLGKLSAPLGVYAVEGNHEYKSGDGDIQHQMAYFSDHGIQVLRDQTVSIDDNFYLIGRKDETVDRATLEQLTDKAEKDLPVILLDHHPSFKDAYKNNAVSLQLSGHTHSGQFFPMQIFNPIISKVSKQYIYGKHTVNDLQLIVSSGMGNWGIPVRVGSKREVVIVSINFVEEK